MGEKRVEFCQSMNSLNWDEMIRLISSGDSVSSPIVAHASRSTGSSAPPMNSYFGVTSNSSKLKDAKIHEIMKIKQRSSEGGYKSKIQKFLYPCKYPSNKHLRRRIKELERKVNNFEKFFYSKEIKKNINNNDEVTEVYLGPNEKKKSQIFHTANGGSRMEFDKRSKENKKIINNDNKVTEVYHDRTEKKKVKIFHKTNGGSKLEFDKPQPSGDKLKPEFSKKNDAPDLSKKQNLEKPNVHCERGSAKNRYTMSQIHLSSSAMEEDISTDSNINLTSDETGRYFFVTSTAGYVKKYDETDSSSAPYEAAATVAKFSKKNLLYLFNQEILPRCVSPSSKNSNGFKSNETNAKTEVKKYVSEKSTNTERTLIDKAVNTKEKHFHVKEDSLPSTYPIDIVLNSKPDTFETDTPLSDISDAVTKFEIMNARMNSGQICFSPYPVSSSCTSASEECDNCIRLSRQ